MRISIIRASKSFIDEIKSIIDSNLSYLQQLFENTDLYQDFLINDEWIKQNFEERELFIARDKGIYIGLITFEKKIDFALIKFHQIKKEHQGNGYGKQLIQFLEMRTLQENLNILKIMCFTKAVEAIKMYKSMNFEEPSLMDKEKDSPFLKKDLILLKKSLPPLKKLNFSKEK